MMSGGSENAGGIRTAVRIIGREPFWFAKAVRRRHASLSIVSNGIRYQTGCLRFRQLEASEDCLRRIVSVTRRVATRPDLYNSVLRWSASFPPEHCVDVCQMGQRNVGRQGMGRAREVQLSTVLVDLVMLKPTEGFVGGEYHFATVLPVAVIVFLLVRVGAAVVAASFFEEGIRDTFLGLVLFQMLPDFSGILQTSSATIQAAMMMVSAYVARTVRGGRYQVCQFRGSELLMLLLVLLLMLVYGDRGASTGSDCGGWRGEIHG